MTTTNIKPLESRYTFFKDSHICTYVVYFCHQSKTHNVAVWLSNSLSTNFENAYSEVQINIMRNSNLTCSLSTASMLIFHLLLEIVKRLFKSDALGSISNLFVC